MFYSYEKLNSYNALLNFVIGERGVGKTFGAKLYSLKDFIRTGNQFVYLRRYKTELDTACSTFFNDLQENNEFDDLELKVKPSKKGFITFYCDGEVCGYGVALSTANILKSTSFAKVKTIIFDEFIIDKGIYRYLNGEVEKFLDIIETIGRMRDIKVYLLGNAVSITNPYFSYFNITLPYGSDFKTFKNGLIVINYIKNLEYRKAKKASRFGQLIDGTNYGRYAIDNEWFRDNKDFVQKRPPKTHYFCSLTVNNKMYGVWRDIGEGTTYLSEAHDPKYPINFACTINDHTPNTIFINLRQNMAFKMMVQNYSDGLLFFENQKVKNVFLPIINKCIAYK